MMKPIVTDTYDFPTLIGEGYVYVDKTAYLRRMISGVDGRYFFMSRPRRFGKSLMISTLEQIFKAIVFADGDGQHPPLDVMAVVKQCLQTDHIVLGARDFAKSGIPFRSRFGNVLTSWIVRGLFKYEIGDTQTGLRAIPARLFEIMLALPGERYEYEMHLFGLMRRLAEPIDIVPIATVYVDNNRASHFRPIKDSIKIYSVLIGDVFGGGKSAMAEVRRFALFAVSSVTSFMLDIMLFCFVYDRLMGPGARWRLFVSIVSARIVSMSYNFLFNAFVVFRMGTSRRFEHQARTALVKYLFLAACIMLCSHLFTKILVWLLDTNQVAWIKAFVDLCLFLASYFSQKHFMK